MTEYQPEDIAKASLLYFAQKILGMKIGRHHVGWAELLHDKKRLLIECSRGHGKTWWFSKAYPLWLLYQGWPIDILVVSYSEEQVKFILKSIDDEIHTNPYLVHLRPTTKQLWGAQLKTFANGSQLRGEGFGSSVRGAHPNLILVDDPLKDQGGMNPEEQLKYFSTALSGTAIRGTQIVVVGTPLDAGDLLEQLETNDAYTFRAYPALDEKGEALFPELFTTEELRAKEKEIGSFAFAREFMLQRIDPKTQAFKDKFRTINQDMDFPDFVSVRTLVDPAISEKDRACDSAVVTVGMDAKNQAWELDTTIVHSDDTSKLLWEVYKVGLRFSKSDKTRRDYAIVWEAELFQKVLAFDFKRLLLERGHDIRTVEVVHQGIQGKHQRIMGLQSMWEARAIHLLPESPLVQQFRYYRPNLKGAKIDALDAFAWVRHPEVNAPYVKNSGVYGEVPEDVYE
jgi:hypothetical protein